MFLFKYSFFTTFIFTAMVAGGREGEQEKNVKGKVTWGGYRMLRGSDRIKRVNGCKRTLM